VLGASSDKRVVRTPSRRITLVVGLAIAIAGLSAPTAMAQTGGSAPPGSTTTTAPTTTTTAPTYSQVFPITSSAAHYYGDGFGASRGKRSHQGQDIFAPCNTMLVSVSNGKVVAKGFQASAGHYVVIRWKWLKQDYAYMHMAYPAVVAKKQRVTVGQFIGAVGETGNASGCHLHFELWQGRWYRGGAPVDPGPSLRYWDSYS
jgi:murein DD-endopeptidase MepM/ murein hydrolase activator NlpD